jgi:hypothetical protein
MRTLHGRGRLLLGGTGTVGASRTPPRAKSAASSCAPEAVGASRRHGAPEATMPPGPRRECRGPEPVPRLAHRHEALARVLAQPPDVLARLRARGTVAPASATSMSVSSGRPSWTAWREAAITTCSISAPVKPSVAAATLAASKAAGSWRRRRRWMRTMSSRSARAGRSTKTISSKRPLRRSSGEGRRGRSPWPRRTRRPGSRPSRSGSRRRCGGPGRRRPRRPRTRSPSRSRRSRARPGPCPRPRRWPCGSCARTRRRISQAFGIGAA